MKKILALILAFAMVASLSIVAFAAAPAYGEVYIDSIIGSNADMRFASIDAFDTMADLTLVPGDIIYIDLGTKDSDDMKSIKLFTTNIMNLDAVSTPTIVFAKRPNGADYRYFAKITLKASTAVASKDVSFDLKLGKTSSSPIETETISFTVKNYMNTAGYDEMAKNYGEIVTATTPLASAGVTTALPVINGPVCSFDDDEEESLEFGDVALFEVDTNGQSTDLYLGWNTTFNSTVAAKYPDANIDFVTFAATPVFNRNGDLYLYADEDTYFYEIVNNEIKATKAVYDEDYGAFTLKTRKLGSYAISDKELKVAAPVVSSSAVTEEKPNVNTGAAVSAVAIDVMAAAAAVVLKK